MIKTEYSVRKIATVKTRKKAKKAINVSKYLKVS